MCLTTNLTTNVIILGNNGDTREKMRNMTTTNLRFLMILFLTVRWHKSKAKVLENQGKHKFQMIQRQQYSTLQKVSFLNRRLFN